MVALNQGSTRIVVKRFIVPVILLATSLLLVTVAAAEPVRVGVMRPGLPLDGWPLNGDSWVVLDGAESLSSRESQRAYEDLLRRASEKGSQVVVSLRGMPLDPAGEEVDLWLQFVRQAVRSADGRVDAFQLGGALGDGRALDSYAFLLKATSLAVRAEGRRVGSVSTILQASLPVEQLERQRELWSYDVAPYVDGLVLGVDGSSLNATLSESIAEWTIATLEYPPAPRLWLQLRGGEPLERASRAIEALGAGAIGVFVEASAADGVDLTRWSSEVDQALAEGYAPAPLGKSQLLDAGGQPVVDGRPLARFFEDRTGRAMVFYGLPPSDVATGQEHKLTVPDPALRETTLLDFTGGESQRVGSSQLNGGRAIRVNEGPLPQAVRFMRPAGPLDLPAEAIESTSQREPTAEEILAQYREVQRVQDDRLERWTAKGRTDFHFRLTAGGSTIDYSIASNYFWERGRELEWEETDYYINGNRLNWKKIPNIPLIQPEKVITLPLDLTLDRTYAYRKVGREKVGDREAWVLAFEPTDPDAPLSLYRGKVWVDVENYERLRSSLVQTRLGAPVLSNEEVDDYELIIGDDGQRYRMLSVVDGQQLWNAGGRNFVVQREVTLWDIQVNPPAEEFEKRRDVAYDGDNKMVRDTLDGFRYLKKEEDGSRTVQTELDTSQLFAGGGGFKDRSTDGIIPLAGVNYFNYDVAGKGVQVNAFFAGVLGFFTFSDPNAFGKNWDTTINASLSGIKPDDELFVGDQELLFERIERRTQNVSFNLGMPVGKFVKLNVGAGGRYIEFFENDDARSALDDFNALPSSSQQLRLILPPDHVEYRSTLGIEFNRRGWSMAGRALAARRSRFGRFGLFDDNSTGFVEFDNGSGNYIAAGSGEIETEFARYSVIANKEWFLPKFQKMRIEANLFSGSNLDRFSRWQFSLFGDTRLNGYSGSGVRFDDGAILRAGYSFNLFEAIRFDANIESGWVEDQDSTAGRQNHGGFGIGANFVAPWKLVVSLNYGRAIWSDIPDLEGEEEFLLLVLKLF